MKIRTTLFISLLFSGIVSAQFKELKKIELSKQQFNGRICSLNDKGLAMTVFNKRDLSIEFFDFNLKKINTVEIPTQRIFLVFKSRAMIYDFFYDSNLKKTFLFHDRYLTHIDPDGSSEETSKIDIPKKFTFDPRFVTVDNNSFLIAYKFKSFHPGYFTPKLKYTTLAKIDWKDGKIEPMPVLNDWQKKRMLSISYVNKKYFSVLYQDNSVKKQKTKNIALFDESGRIMVKKLITSKASSKPIIDYKITEFENSEIIVSGTYGSNVESDYSQGIVVSKQINFKTVYINHFDFTTIKDFYKYLPAKQKEKMDKKAAKKNSRGKHIQVVSYSHNPVKIGDALIVTTEFCYPHYHTETRTSVDAQGHASTTTVQVFDGFIYTHAIVLGLNEKGEKKFEHFIPVGLDYKPYHTIQAMKTSIVDETINYSYSLKGQLIHYSITYGLLKEHKPIEMVKGKSGSKKDGIIFSDLNLWYGNYYYSSSEVITKGPKKRSKSEKEFFLIKYELKL